MGEVQGSAIPPRRSTARPSARRRFREPIDFGQWDGWCASQVDPFELLLQVAGNVMGRYQIWCGMHGFSMPVHLGRAPSGKAGWGGEAAAEPRRDWIWVRIARRCLRLMINPLARIFHPPF